MKRNDFLATTVAGYSGCPNNSFSACTYDNTYTLSSYIYNIRYAREKKARNLLLNALHTHHKKYNLSRWIAALLFAVGPVASHAADTVQRDTVRGDARVAFAICDAKVSPDFSGNLQELEKITTILKELQADTTANLQRIVIRGYGSPDGRYVLNERLARQRTENLKAYVAQHANLPKNLIEVKYVAEDWEGLTAQVEAATLENMPHRDDVLKVVKSNLQPDEKESIIRKDYPVDFQYLKDFCLPQLRRSDYSIEYLTRNASVIANTGLVSVNGQSTGSGSSGVSQQVAGHGSEASQQEPGHQQQMMQAESGASGERLMLWKAIIAGLSLLLLLAAFMIYRLYKNLQEKQDKIERQTRELNYYRLAAQRKEEDLQPVVEKIEPVVEKKEEVDNPVIVEPQRVMTRSASVEETPSAAVAAAAAAAATAIAFAGAEATEKEPEIEAPVVAQNSDISDEKENSEKYESFDVGDKDDFERFQKMDKAVTEGKLFLNGDIDRSQLMRIAGVDKNRFANIIRKFAKTNFAGYVNAKRMEYALNLIKENPDYTMKTIGEMCGFNSQSTFFRVFKSVYGITPTEFSQTGKLPTEEAVLPFEDELPKSQDGQNSTKNARTISFDIPAIGEEDE